MLELMKKLVQQFGASLVIVTHNLGVVARYVQRIYVMYAGTGGGRRHHQGHLRASLAIPTRSGCSGRCPDWTRSRAPGWYPSRACRPISSTCRAPAPSCPVAPTPSSAARPTRGRNSPRWATATASAVTSTWRTGTLNQPSPDPQEVAAPRRPGGPLPDHSRGMETQGRHGEGRRRSEPHREEGGDPGAGGGVRAAARPRSAARSSASTSRLRARSGSRARTSRI